jgi:hypothetical protein
MSSEDGVEDDSEVTDRAAENDGGVQTLAQHETSRKHVICATEKSQKWAFKSSFALKFRGLILFTD